MTMKQWLFLLGVIALVGCSANAEKPEVLPVITGTQPLEVPPGLVLPEKNHRMDIPPVEEKFTAK